MSDNEHAPLAPSASPQWGHCSGSVLAQANLPNPETEQTREGTAAHWVMAEVLEAAKAGRHVTCASFIGQKAPNGVMIDDKMAEGAEVMVEDVLAVCERFGALGELMVERRVHMPQIHPQNWGTLDAGLYLRGRRVIFLWDYKHGHRECSPVDNFQLIDYLGGLVNEFGLNGIDDQQTMVVARIVQPFCYSAPGPVREWTCTLSDLRGAWNVLAAKAHEAFTDPKLTTGPHCRDCRAVGKCAATRRARYNFIELVNEPYEMDQMNGADLATERGILKDGIAVAKARLEAIEDELHHRITGGQTDSGLTVESKPGRLEWTAPPAVARALCGQFGVDISKDAVLTPTQAKAAAPKEVRPLLEQVIANYTRRPAGSLQLVKADESRTARAFKKRN